MQTTRIDDSGQSFAGCAAVVAFAIGASLNCVPESWVRARQTIEKGNYV